MPITKTNERIDINARRIINGKDGDVIQLYPIKHKFAWDAYNTGNANHWLPNEISMQQDLEQWKSSSVLTEDERRAFETVLGFFTTADSIAANNIVLAAYKHITSPECRMYLLRQGFEEAVHTQAYQYIVESLGLDEGKIFNMYREIDAIYNKASFILTFNEGIFDPNFKTGTLESDQKFLENIIVFSLIMEGIFFYSAFAVIFGFQRQHKMVGSAEQIQYIMRDECVTPDTELLTPRGWKFITELQKGDVVVQYVSENNTLEFAPIKETSKSRVSNIYRFRNYQNHVSLEVSENHRMVYWTKHKNLKIIAAKDATLSHYAKHISTAPLAGGQRESLSIEERFLIALQADGSLSPRYTGEISGTIPATFSFKKDRKINRFRNILESLGWDFKEYTPTHKPEYVNFRVNVPLTTKATKDMSTWVSLEDKTFNWCKEFIDEVAEWDGHWVTQNRITWGSVIPQNTDIVQAVASLAGYRTHRRVIPDNRRPTFSTYYRLEILKNFPFVVGGSITKERVPYDGYVYGVEVPSSFMLVRHNGAVSVTGNSQHLNFGVNTTKTIREEQPELWTPEFQARIVKLVREAAELEITFAQTVFPKGIFGMNAEGFSQYIHHIADRRLQSIGLPAQWNVENPFPWMSEAVDLNKEKNFFETRVIEYQTGGALQW